MKVGVVGVGMVGSALLQTFCEKGLKVIAYDKKRPGFTDEDVHFDSLIDAKFVFVSVPTLTLENGQQDIKPLEEVFKRLCGIKYKGIVVSKCTTLPGTTRSLASTYSQLKVVHNPEFLRAASAYEDFKFQKSALLSGYPDHILEVAEFLRDLFPNLSIKLYTSYAATEIAKYTHNCFLATKVSFLNEIYDICQTYGISYDEMIRGASMLGGIGETHLAVPGTDGKRGWAGFCFPKDTKAFITSMKAQGIPMDTLAGAIETNKKVRK